MKFRVLLTLGVLGILAYGGWYVFGGQILETAKEELQQKAADIIEGKADPSDIAALAVKAISLTQGEHGVELWRLKAEWGSMQSEGGILLLEKPRFTYFMPPDNAEVSVASQSGDVDQASKLINFRDQVTAVYDGRTLRGDHMVYDGNARVLDFPKGANFSGAGMHGEAPQAWWDLDNQVIRAEGGVSFTWERTPDTLSGSDGEPRGEATLPENG